MLYAIFQRSSTDKEPSFRRREKRETDSPADALHQCFETIGLTKAAEGSKELGPTEFRMVAETSSYATAKTCNDAWLAEPFNL